MKIFLGPAGIPLSAKATSTIEGVRAVASLGLNAMEIEFVQQVYLDVEKAKLIGKVAKDFDVKLSVHAPFYINLCSKNPAIVEASKERIVRTATVGEAMGADVAAIHVAYYSGLTEDAAFEKIKTELSDILEMDVNVKLGIETMGRKSQFGSLDEVLRLCKEVDVIPYIDWGHLFVRDNGKIDYGDILDKLKKFGHINSHFECVAKNSRGQYVDQHIPIVFNTPPFEPLAKEILKRKHDITIICESPLIDRDSLVMKSVFENLGYEF